MRTRQRGFTLIELSIVLAIVGLLVGGVVTGQSLIKAAELRKILRQAQSYQTAAQNFRQKYAALPGDITDASDYWGLQSSDKNTCADTPATGTATCNGDGDGMIDYDYVNDGTATPHETYRVWQHLANAGLIEGTYSGARIGSAGAPQAEPGVTAPKGYLPNSIWGMWYVMNDATWSGYAAPVTRGHHIIIFGGSKNPGSENGYNLRWHMPVLTPSDASSLDSKMDDGMPYNGKVTDLYGPMNTSNCATDTTNVTAKYSTGYKQLACVLIFEVEI